MDPRTRAKGLAHRRPASPAGAVTRFEAEPSAAMPLRMRHRVGAANPAAPIRTRLRAGTAYPAIPEAECQRGIRPPCRDVEILPECGVCLRMEDGRLRGTLQDGHRGKAMFSRSLGVAADARCNQSKLGACSGSLENTAGKSVSRAREPKGVQTRRPARDYIAAADNGSSSTSRALDSSS